VHAIPDQFIEHGPQAYQRSKLRLDAAGIVDTVFELYPELAQLRSQPRERRDGVHRRAVGHKETVTW